MNPVLILTYNNLDLTKRAVESVYNQRVKTEAWIVDNGSKDGTAEWAQELGILLHAFPYNEGVSAGWNMGLNLLFWKHKHVLAFVVGNDTVLPPWWCGEILAYGKSFVTGVAVDQMPGPRTPEKCPLNENPDFSAFMIERGLWEEIGPFNERMPLYCQDCDMHVRAHRMGIKLWQANVPFYHERSSTMTKADPKEQAVLRAQADADRGTFRAMYGVTPGDEKYPLLFK